MDLWQGQGGLSVRSGLSARPNKSPARLFFSTTGARASMTRARGKVAMTSVRSAAWRTGRSGPDAVPMIFCTIGSPRPAPCSAVFCASEPWPKEESTVSISSSGIPGPLSRTEIIWPPSPLAGDKQRDLARLRGELDGVAEEVEHHLADGPLVAPDLGQVVAGRKRQLDTLGLGADFHHPPAILGNIDQRHGLFVEFVLAGLDAAEVQQFVDQVEQMLAARMDIAGVFLVLGHGVRAEQFRLEYFGEADDGVERGAQLMGSWWRGTATWRCWPARRGGAPRPTCCALPSNSLIRASFSAWWATPSNSEACSWRAR